MARHLAEHRHHPRIERRPPGLVGGLARERRDVVHQRPALRRVVVFGGQRRRGAGNEGEHDDKTRDVQHEPAWSRRNLCHPNAVRARGAADRFQAQHDGLEALHGRRQIPESRRVGIIIADPAACRYRLAAFFMRRTPSLPISSVTSPRGARSRSSRTRTRARPRSPKSCCSTAARSSWPAPSRRARARATRRRTGWKWKSSAASR